MSDKRIVLGKKGSDFVLQVSKPGVDVIDDSPNTRDLLFNSLDTYRSGIIVSDTTVTGTMNSSGVAIATTTDSSGTNYIPAYQIIEKGVKSNFTQFQETTNVSFAGLNHTLNATVTAGLPTSAGGGMFELSLGGSGTTTNLVKPVLFDITEVENPTGSVNGNYPYIESRNRGSGDGNVDILVLRIPCQYGKMNNNAALFGNSELAGVISGGGGSGASPSAPTINSVSRIARDANNDTVRVSASSGSNNSGTITYGVNTSNSAPTSFQSSTDFTQPRNSTRYYFAKQGGVASSGTSHVSAAVGTTPNAFTFTDVTSVALNSTNTSNTITIAGLGTGDTATVSLSGTAGSKQYSKNGAAYTSSSGTAVNGDTFSVRGTASGSNSTAVTVILTIGGVADTYSITTIAVASDTTPNAFGNFTAVTASQLNTVNTSNTITIAGINTASAVSISGNGTFSIAGGGYTTSGNVTNGQTITVRLTSSGSFSTAVSTTLNVGGVTGSYSVTTRAAVAATTPTDIVATQTTNTSASSQNLTVTGSGGSGTTQVSSNNSSWVSNGSTFSQSRNSTVTYYARNVGETTSSSYSETKFIPPVVSGISANVASASLAAGGVDDTYSPSRGAGFTNYSSYWGTVSTSISDNASWLTTSITNSSLGYYRVQTSANTSTSSRSATVTYTTFTQFGHQHVYTYTFTQAGIAVDTTPAQFTFSDVVDRTLNTLTYANDQITGINTATNATYSGDANGSFSVTGINGTYNQSAKSVSNGTQIHVKILSANTNSTARNATITVGGVSDTFSVTTEAASDSTPDAFSFTDVTGAASTTNFTSTITLAGFNTAATASMSSSAVQASFRVNSGSFGTGSQTVNSGDSITALVRSATGSFQSQSIIITVGGVSDTFTVLTGNTGGSGGIE